MKKFMAIFVLALFVIGMLPAALAEDAGAGSSEGTADDSTADASSRGRLKEKIEKRKEAIENAREKALENRKRLAAAKDALLAKHEARVAELIERCVEKNATEADCKARFEKRLENIAALAPKFKEKLRQFEERRQERIQNLKEMRNDTIFGKFERGKEFRARVLEKAKILKAQAELAKARGRYQEAFAGLDKAKLRLEQAKTSKVCKTAPDSEECAKAREELRTSAKEKLVKHAEIIISSLENAKEKVTGSEYLTDEEEKAALEFLENQLAKFNEIKADIEKAATKEEIIAAGEKLSDAWKEAKHRINAYVSYAANARMAGIVVKAGHLSAKLERVLERMAENGKDTSAVEPLVNEFKSLLETAKTKFKSAHSLLLELRTSELSDEEKKAKLDEANALIKEVKKALRDANAKLREIFLKLKETGAAAELAEAAEADDVESEAEENEAEESA